LQSISKEHFDYFYPTSVMETGYDILRAWVSRMIMVGYYETKQIPFEHVFLHGMVRDSKGQKMSKSKGNVINPLDMIEKYGADALRAALIFGTKEGGDVVLSEDKIRSMRNFGNKIWNIGRFISLNKENKNMNAPVLNKEETRAMKQLEKEFSAFEKKYHQHFKKFEFAKAFDLSYDFLWHRFADVYIEELKGAMQNGNMDAYKLLEEVFTKTLKMLHPYVPFVTEVVWQQYYGDEVSILDTPFAITR